MGSSSWCAKSHRRSWTSSTRPTTPQVRSRSTSMRGRRDEDIRRADASSAEVVVAYHERTKHHFHRYARASISWGFAAHNFSIPGSSSACGRGLVEVHVTRSKSHSLQNRRGRDLRLLQREHRAFARPPPEVLGECTCSARWLLVMADLAARRVGH